MLFISNSVRFYKCVSNFRTSCHEGGAFHSLFCPEGRVFVHNDCPGEGFALFKSCPRERGRFWMKLISALISYYVINLYIHIVVLWWPSNW